jgi:hypothetical protein
MNGLVTFWTWAYLIGCGLFLVVAVIVAPLGWRDMIKLFRALDQAEESDESK